VSAECRSCLSLMGEQPISPGPVIYDGTYWMVEHAYPTRMRGWLVILLKRHVEALHELNKVEFIELAEIEYKLAQIMGQLSQVEKEYLFCTGEGEGFQHLHLHFVPKPKGTLPGLIGAGIFQLLGVEKEDAIPLEEIVAVSQKYRDKYMSIE